MLERESKEQLKAQIAEQAKLVQLELTATNQGYQQALGWVSQLLAQSAPATTNSGPTVVATNEVHQEK